jgi:ribosomal protein S18 acetylase RimI-like enzyme
VPDDQITLRWATPDDAARLAHAAATFFADTFGPDNTPEDMSHYLASAFSERQQRAELEDPANRVLVALGGDNVVAGYVHLKLGTTPRDTAIPNEAKKPMEIARLYADRRWHGQGLGGRLMNAAVKAAREWGADVIWLGVWERNARAIAFYRKHGFRVIGEQWFMLGADRQRDLVMARELTAEV